MRTTSSISFFCRPSKADKKGLAPIEMAILICGKRTFISLPRKMNPRDFETLLKQRKSNSLQEYLNLQRETVNNVINELIKNERPVTPATIKEFIQTGGIKVYTVGNLIEDFLNSRKYSTNTSYDVYERFKNAVMAVSLNVGWDTQLTNVTNDDMLKVKFYLESNYAAGTASGKFNKIRMMFKYAVNNGKLTSNPTCGITVSKGKPKIEFLTDEEVERIANKRLFNDRLEKVRKLFLLQCCTGLAYVDLSNFDSSKVKEVDSMYIYTNQRHKTDITFHSVILPLGVEILKEINWDVQSIIMSNAKLNNYLKELGAICHIEKDLHTHLGRKTYATKLINSGVDLPTVKKCVGHEANSNITTRIYAFLQESTVASNVSKALSSLGAK